MVAKCGLQLLFEFCGQHQLTIRFSHVGGYGVEHNFPENSPHKTTLRALLDTIAKQSHA